MGVSQRPAEQKAFIADRAAREADRKQALAIIEAWNARLANNRPLLFSPTVGAALLAKHHWLIVVCDACGTVTDMDVSMKPRDPHTPLTALLSEALCPRCNGHGRPRPVGLSRSPSD